MDKTTPRPWLLREHPNIGCFIEGKKADNMPYALDICGDDYTGYGDEPVRKANMQLIVVAVNNYDNLIEKATKVLNLAPASIGGFAKALHALSDAINKAEIK